MRGGTYWKQWPNPGGAPRRNEGASPIKPMEVRVADEHHIAGERALRVVTKYGKVEYVIETDNPGRFKPGQELIYTWKGAKAGKGGRVINTGTLERAKSGPAAKEPPREEGGGPAAREEKRRDAGDASGAGADAGGASGTGSDGEETTGGEGNHKRKKSEEGGEGDGASDPLEEEILSALASVQGTPGSAERRARRETRPTEEAVLSFTQKEKFKAILPTGESVHVRAHGALPGDRVKVAKVPDSNLYEVVEMVQRYPHLLIGTARIADPGTGSMYRLQFENEEDQLSPEQVEGDRGAVMFFPDSLDFQKEPFALAFKVPGGVERDKKLALRRNADPEEEEWSLAEDLGIAGEPRDEIEAIAKRTRNGAKKVEDLTDEDLEAFAKELSGFPELAAELRSITMEQVRAQLQRLTMLNEQLRTGQLSTEALVARFLPSPALREPQLGEFGRKHWGTALPGEGEPDPEQAIVEAREAYRHGENRLDFRNIPTFTIDPETAKDFDDALSCRVLPDGRIEVSVHIADPTAFIPQGSPLDIIARFRQKTQYLRTITLPVFPHVLSDDLCSLNQDEDKLAFSTVFTFPPRDSWTAPDVPPQPEVWHGRTVIRSDKRFTYEEAQAILSGGSGQYHEELALTKLLADAYRAERAAKGVTEMTSENELEFIIDPATGRPTGVKSNERLDSMRLIEDWMIRANKAVSTTLSEQGLVFQRYHPPPFPDKLFAAFDKLKFNDLIPPEDEWGTADLRALLKVAHERIKKAPRGERSDMEGYLLSAMERAGYALVSKEELESGLYDHYGLSLDRYSHYTSPIRRYPDIATHTLLDALLSGEPVTRENPKYASLISRFEEAAEIINEIERDLDHNENDAREVLGLYLLKSGIPEGASMPVRAQVKRVDAKGMELAFRLPGGGMWKFWVRRKFVVEQDFNNELSKEDWKKFREGEEYDFSVESIDVSLRKMTLSYDPRKAVMVAETARVERMAAEEKARFDGLTDGTMLGLSVESAEDDGTILVTLHDRKMRVAHQYVLTREKLLAPGGTPLSDAVWKALRPRTGITDEEALIKIGVRLRRSGEADAFELLRLPKRPERQNPFEAFAEKYKNKEVVSVVTGVVGDEIIVDFMTKPKLKGYRIPRGYFAAVPNDVWKRAEKNRIIIFQVTGFDAKERRIGLNWIEDRPPREKKEGDAKGPRQPRGDGGSRGDKKGDRGGGKGQYRPRQPRGDRRQRGDEGKK